MSRIFIEISGKCNAKCPYCARQRFKQRHLGKNMSPALFEQILDHLQNIGSFHRLHNSMIYLYNWGEPFLNTEINCILKILKKKKLYAGISSNFIVTPEIDKENYPIIREVIFSLSGFSQNSYGKIHGASLNKVLNNLDNFHENIRKFAPDTNIDIAWHRYTFNERELWTAYKYFDRLGIRFKPAVAVLNDLHEMLNYAEGRLSENRQEEAERDLFLNYLSQVIAYHRQKSKHYHCFMWNSLVIDEAGQLLLCCGMTKNDLDHILGNALEMLEKEIWEKKLTDSICIRCISSGVARASLNFGNPPLPSGGKETYEKYYKLWYQLNLSKILRTIKDIPGGEEIAYIAKKIRDTVRFGYSQKQ